MRQLGNIAAGQTVTFMFPTNDGDGAAIAPTTAGTVSVYKNADTSETTTGVTYTPSFDSVTGVNLVQIDTTDSFYAAGNDFTVVLSGAVVDGSTINTTLADFSIENRVANANVMQWLGEEPLALRNQCVQSDLAISDAENGVSANCYFVSKSGSDTNDGRSWQSAFLTVGAAASACSGGETVYLGPGTFSGAVSFAGKVNLIGSGSGTILTQNVAGTKTLTMTSGSLSRLCVTHAATTYNSGNYAIYAPSSRITIDDCAITSMAGIGVFCGGYVYITNSNIYALHYGIQATHSSGGHLHCRNCSITITESADSGLNRAAIVMNGGVISQCHIYVKATEESASVSITGITVAGDASYGDHAIIISTVIEIVGDAYGSSLTMAAARGVYCGITYNPVVTIVNSQIFVWNEYNDGVRFTVDAGSNGVIYVYGTSCTIRNGLVDDIFDATNGLVVNVGEEAATNGTTGIKTQTDQLVFQGNRVKAVALPTNSGVGDNSFQFTMSASLADPIVIASNSTVAVEQYFDTMRTIRRHTDATVGTQWQAIINVLQNDPSGTNPPIEFTSSDESVATVNSEGLVEYVGNGTCAIAAVSRATEDSPSHRFALEITNTSSGGASATTVEYLPDAFSAADHLLVVYNADVADSVALKDYYLANRPGISGANTLGITGFADATSLSTEALAESLVSQISAWVEANPSVPINRVVCLRGVPSRYGSSSSGGAVSMLIAAVFGNGSYKTAANRFSRGEYDTVLTTYLDMGSYAATTAYIDKLVATAETGLQSDGITISGSDAGIGGDYWILDDKRTSYYVLNWIFRDDNSGLLDEGISEAYITYQSLSGGPLISSAADVTFFGNWGIHTGVLSNGWPCNGSIQFSGNSGWWIGMSVESYNGIYGSSHGDPTEFFVATAFGGTNYANTPVGFVCHTAEPYASGISSQHYSRRWARGWTFAEAAWCGRNTNNFLAVGDPFVTR